VQAGRTLFNDNCGACHGLGAMSANVIPDLRYLDAEKHRQFEDIVHGARSHLGMPPFGGRLETDDIEKIRAFLIQRAHDLKNELAGVPPATEEKTK